MRIKADKTRSGHSGIIPNALFFLFFSTLPIWAVVFPIFVVSVLGPWHYVLTGPGACLIPICLTVTLLGLTGLTLSWKTCNQLAKQNARPTDASDAADTVRQECKQIVVDCNPYESIIKFVKLLLSFEKFYWIAWALSVGVPIALTAPGLWYQFLAYYPQTITLRQADDFCNWYFQGVRVYVEPILNGLGHGAEGFHSYLMTPYGALSALCMVIASVVVLLPVFTQPNALILSERKFKVRRKLLSNLRTADLFDMADLHKVSLFKPLRSPNADKWRIVFGTDRRPNELTVKLAAMSTDDRHKLIHALEKWAPSAQIDAELVQILKSSDKKSYTELWLASLSAPPKRERLSPLPTDTALHNGKYTVVRQLAAGGQGTAYVATHKSYSPAAGSQEKTIVLKEFIMPVYVDREVRRQALERFENEATMLHNLNNPRIVKLMDYFIEDHRAYLVLEHIDGMSLRNLVDTGGPLDSTAVSGLAAQMCDILEYLHSLSPPVVHRDFTPDNLILGSDGILKLIDFNVAQQKDTTTTGTVVGKHAYLPPEQFRGKPTTQSDIYAMGCTLHFLLTGKDPEPLTQSHPILNNEAVSPELESIVAGCTFIDARKRFQSIVDIRTVLTTDPEQAEFFSIKTNQHDSIGVTNG